jgi:voltage-gated potassium channel
VALLITILASVVVVMLDSMDVYHAVYGDLFRNLELGFTLVFTLEYLVRLWCVRNPMAYAISFWGVIDLLAILPTFLTLFVPEASSLIVIRLLRVLRVFRILHLFELHEEYIEIIGVLRATSRSILVFFSLVMVTVVVFGCLLYVIDGPEHGFVSIPMSIYWAVVTITTVGYGDVVPGTPMGRFVASIGILVGYSILAVPTAIITSKLWERLGSRKAAQTLAWNCQVCAGADHALDATYCKHCGAEMEVPDELREQKPILP